MKNKYIFLFSILFSLFTFNIYAEEVEENTETKTEEVEEVEETKEVVNTTPKKPKKYYRNMFELGGTAYYGFQNYEFEEPDNHIITIGNVDLKDNGFLYGANLKYKIYFVKKSKDTFFMAPEFIYGFGSIKSTDNIDDSEISLTIKPTYGFKLSLGFESNGKYSFSIGAGAQNISYDYTHSKNNYSETGKFWAPFVAFDFQRNIVKYLYIGLNFHYYFSDFDLKDSQVALYAFPSGYFMRKIDKLEGKLMTAGITLGFRF